MNLSVLRRTPPPIEETDTLSPLRDRVESLASRSRSMAEKSAALDARDADLRRELDAAVRDGRDADGTAAQVAGIPGERAALVAQARAVEGALAEARGALEVEERKIREAEFDAQEARLRAAEAGAEERFRGALVGAGVAFETLLAAEQDLRRFLDSAGRPSSRGFLDLGAQAFEAAREAARRRAREAVERGADGSSASSEAAPLPFANIKRRRTA